MNLKFSLSPISAQDGLASGKIVVMAINYEQMLNLDNKNTWLKLGKQCGQGQ